MGHRLSKIVTRTGDQGTTGLATGERLAPPTPAEAGELLTEHLDALHALYGEAGGVRIARKHIQWYCRSHPGSEAFWQQVNRVERAAEQRRLVRAFFGLEADAPALPQAA